MINVILKTKTSFNVSPNELMPIHDDYTLNGGACAWGNFAKTNIFIGENNSGKSRFLRYLFKESFYSLDFSSIEKIFSEFRLHLENSESYDEMMCPQSSRQTKKQKQI